MLPLSISIRGKESLPDLAKKFGQIEHFSKIPDSVLHDHELSTAARCVYAQLSGSCHSTQSVSIGHRRIALLLGLTRPTVAKALKDLKMAGYIAISGGDKSRCTYVLMSARSKSIESAKATKKPKATVICPRCRKLRGGLLRVGVCRSCNSDAKLDRKIDIKVDTAVEKKLAATA